MNRTLLVTLLMILFRIGCFAAFLLQLVSVSQRYFAFPTRTRVEQSVAGKLLIPHLAVCARYSELVVQDPVPLTDDSIYRIAKKETVADLFRMSPSPEESLVGCATRSTDNPYLMQWKSQKECLMQFEVRKFYMQESMCYQFRWRKESYANHDQVAHSIHYGGVFYILSLSQSMDRVYHMRPILFTSNSPIGSRMYGETVVRRASESMSSETYSNLYEITYAYTEFQMLEYPYDTMCIKTNGTNNCVRNCVIDQVFRKLKKLPFTEIIYEDDPRTKVHHLNQDDLNNKTTYKTYKAIQELCGHRCRGNSCKYSRASSKTNSELRPEHTNIRLVVMIPDTSTTTIIHEARMYPVEFVVILLSCFGIWFGLSVIALNPFDDRLRRRLCSLIKHTIKSFSKGNWLRRNTM